jgi:uncharacterized membrane protein YfcA
MPLARVLGMHPDLCLMHIDLYVALAGLVVGFTVGLTGMGGGALMTPILVLLFGVQPLTAVSSDLVAAVVMKPVGAGVHVFRRTVNWDLVRWLCMGSVPAAFCGVFVLRSLGTGQQIEDRLKFGLGAALLVAAGSIVAKGFLQARQTRRDRTVVANGGAVADRPFALKRGPTIAIGVIGGLVVGMTSVGSGSLIIVALLLLYPMLRSSELVGTDLAQAIPLVASAALGHVLYGDFQLGLTTSVLIGSIPGVYLGARLSSRAPDGIIRPALVFVLLASALKLLEMGTTQLGVALLAFVLVGLPIWGAVDAAGYPGERWEEAGLTKRTWVAMQAIGAPFLLGFGMAVAYFATARPRLVRPVVEPVTVAA